MSDQPRRALVLGGGGVTGIGWEVGLIAGLLNEGVDLRAADTVIGTSAGSFVGTNFTAGIDWDAEFARQSRATETEPNVSVDPAVYQGWQSAFRNGGGDFAAVGRGFGQVARDFPAAVSPEVRRRAVRDRLATQTWPSAMRITVTDARTGEIHLLGPTAGIPIETATAASGAVPGIWPSVEFDGREWVDAGMVSAANATLAEGHDRILVLAPMPEGYAGIPSAADDVASLSQTASAALVAPDAASREAIGANPYDPARAAGAADAGRAQGRTIAKTVHAMW